MQRVATDTLKNLSSLERLTELFYRDLNYGYSSSVISKRTWKEQIANSVKELSLIGTQGDFHIIYCQIEKLLLGIERPIINQLLKEHPYLLAIFSDPQFTNWHFVNVKYDEELKNRRLFRRIVIGPDERLHTAAQRINMLEVVDEKISPLELQIEHDKAFDVEEVTKEFYNRFTEIFHILDKDIAEENPQLDTAKQAQIILNRLIFLYFIQKKGWLNNNKRYLYKNFLTYWEKNPKGNSFYSDFLFELFQALSSQDNLYKDILGNVPFLNGGLFEVDPFPISPQLQPQLVIKNSTFKQIFDDLLEHFNFTVREDTPLDIEVAIDPEMLGKIFENLVLKLEKDEDLRKKTGSYYTPRVIVHFMCQQSLKEYLGSESEIDKSKIESLFAMGPADQLSEEELKKLETLISIPQARLLKSLIKKAYILDPAVGSGAFLVGMLHEILSIIKLSDIREFGQEYIQRSNYNYELKRELIETSLCGVDIQDRAVRICELRLWLSLIVDYEKVEGEDVPPLPNLSYKIRCGDSLIEKLFGYNVQLDQLVQTDKGRQLIDEIREIKEDYFLEPNIQEKFRLEIRTVSKQCELLKMLIKTKINYVTEWVRIQPDFFGVNAEEKRQREEKQKQLTEYEFILSSVSNKQKKVEAMLKGKIPKIGGNIHKLRQSLGISFIWKLDFAEVFKDKQGFDIIIANPPYVRISGITDVEDKLIRNTFSCVFGHYDIYIPFLEKGVKLLKFNGILSYITPNKYLTKRYANKLRPFLLNETSLIRLVDTSQARTFDSVSVYPVITLLKKARGEGDVKIAILNDYNFQSYLQGEDSIKSYNVKQKEFFENENCIFDIFVNPNEKAIFKKMLTNSANLGNYSKILTGTPAINKFYQWHNLLLEENSLKNITKPHLKFINVSNVKPYFIEWGKEIRAAQKRLAKPYLIYDDSLIGKNKWKVFRKKKIVIKGTALRLTAAYDDIGFANLSLYAIIFNQDHDNIDKTYYHLALLNSKLLNLWYCKKFASSNISGNYISFNGFYLAQLPINEVSHSDQIPFAEIVYKILTITKSENYLLDPAKQANVKEYECQIDQMVYELYSLTDREITLVEGSIK